MASAGPAAGLAVRQQSSDVDWRCVNTVRTLAIDMVQTANSGHPGAPMGCAPMAHVLFSRHVKFDPTAPKWANRDRFVLSNGHACALQYSLLHLLGYNVTLDDLRKFRQVGSITPGHPENFMTPGIEVTTGPLGQGFANAVGLAIAESHLAAVFNRSDLPPLVDNYTYVITGDGCLQEGVCCEAASLAGHLGLGKLIVLYDDNHIQIDGDTELAFTEDVLARFESYGWHTLSIADGDNDLVGLDNALKAARAETGRPSLIKVRTTIGYGATHQNTEKVHGAPLGPKEVAAVKSLFGFNPETAFHVPDEVRDFYASLAAKGRQAHADHDAVLARYRERYPEVVAEYERRCVQNALPANWKDALPRFDADKDAAAATRKHSQTVLNKLAEKIPDLVGGSADLTHSNLTWLNCSKDYQKNSREGRYLRFGVREHAMAAICNGLSAYGGFIPFAATFLNFIGYAQGAVRLSALSHFGVVYIMTHDSIGLGEDGPTHQPIETLASCRATPNLLTIRPADGNETSGAYAVAVEQRARPSVLALTRQNVPHLHGSSVEAVAKGAYILADASTPDVALIGTGSEVSLCVQAAKLLKERGIQARIISMPCNTLFDEQPIEYRRSVLTSGVPVLSVEAATTFGWERYSHAALGLDHFGASGPADQIYAKFGITAAAVADKAEKLAQYYAGGQRKIPELVRDLPF